MLRDDVRLRTEAIMKRYLCIIATLAVMAPASAWSQASLFAAADQNPRQAAEIDQTTFLGLFTGITLSPQQDSVARDVIHQTTLARARVDERSPSFADSVTALLADRDARLRTLLADPADQARPGSEVR